VSYGKAAAERSGIRPGPEDRRGTGVRTAGEGDRERDL